MTPPKEHKGRVMPLRPLPTWSRPAEAAPPLPLPPHPADDPAGPGEEPAGKPATPPLEGHIIAPAGQGPAWLARPVRELPAPPPLPPLLPSRDQVRDLAGWAAKWAAWHARFHTRRLPRYVVRILIRCTRAAGRGVRWWAGWVYCPDLAAHVGALRHQMRLIAAETRNAAKGDAAAAVAALGMQLTATRKRLAAWRAVKLALSAGTVGGGLGALDSAAASAGGWVYLAAAAVAAGVGVVAGRSNEGPPVVDSAAGAMPVRVDLTLEQLNAAFRAAGLLKGDAALVPVGVGIGRQGNGWAVVVDMPRGSGKTAADAIARRDTIAGELGVDEIQLIMRRVRAAAGGHAGRLSIWVADDDPYLGKPTISVLADAERFDFWKPVPFGRDAQGNRIEIGLLWQSAFFGGLPRRGKTFAMRLLVAAAVLDPWVRIYAADGKGGADFRPLAQVAHTYVSGADEARGDLAAFEAMLDELIGEMTRRFALFATLPSSMCPEGKLTPQIMRTHDMPLILIVIDELQEYLDALETDKDRARIIGKMARIARRAPAAGFMPIYASQRPDAKSVPTKLREIVSYRYCTQVVDKTSSDMVLGDGKAAQGADASTLSEEHVGVGVLVTGPASHVTVKADYLDNVAFEAVCARGRTLREKAGTLSGQATGSVATATAGGFTIPPIVADVLEAMGNRTRIWTDDLLNALVNIDEDTYGDYDAARLAAELDAAGVIRSSKQVRIGDTNRAGYLRRDIEGVIPPEYLARPQRVEGAPATGPADPNAA